MGSPTGKDLAIGRSKRRDVRKVALQLTRDGEIEAALAAWKEVIEIDSHDPVARLALARMYAKRGNLAIAVEHLDAISPNSAKFAAAEKLKENLARRQHKRPVAGSDIAVRSRQDCEPTQTETLALAAVIESVVKGRASSTIGKGTGDGFHVQELVYHLKTDADQQPVFSTTSATPHSLTSLWNVCVQSGRTHGLVSSLLDLRPEALTWGTWLEAAQLAQSAGSVKAVAIEDFCVRAVGQSKARIGPVTRASEIMLSAGMYDAAARLWRAASEGIRDLKYELGLVRVLSRHLKSGGLASEGLQILARWWPYEELDHSDQLRIVEIARRTASDGVTDTGAFQFTEMQGSPGWANWLRAVFYQGCGEFNQAVTYLRELIDGGVALGPLDLHAELALTYTACNRFGDASLQFGKANSSAIGSNPYYVRAWKKVEPIVKYCGSDSNILYPESLIDIILEHVGTSANTSARYPRSVLTVCATLGQGGGERQAVTMVRQLAEQEDIAEINVAVRSIEGEGQSFFLSQLESIGLKPIIYGSDWRTVSPIQTFAELELADQRVAGAVDLLPHGMREEVIRMCKMLHELRPDIVHIRQDMYGCAVACAIYGVPRVVIHRGSLAPDKWGYNMSRQEVYLRPLRHVYRKLLERPGVTIVNNSKIGRDSDREWLGWPDASRFEIVYNAMEFERWTTGVSGIETLKNKIGIQDGDFVIGGVFRLSAVKRPMFWMEAAARIARGCPNARFIVVGDGEFGEPMREYSRQQGFSEKLYMPGRVDDVGPWYGLMDLNMLTSEREGLPNVLIEGQHYGVPALAPDVGGVAEAVAPNITGYVLSQTATADDFAEAALQIWRMNEWRDAARRRGPDFVHARFGTAQAVSAILTCFGFENNC